jgi:translocation and assembly module TamA
MPPPNSHPAGRGRHRAARSRRAGRPLAKPSPAATIVADHATTTLDVTLDRRRRAGRRLRSRRRSKGTEAVDRDFTAYMAGLEPGRRYSPKDIDDARDRLLGARRLQLAWRSRKATGARRRPANIPIDVTRQRAQDALLRAPAPPIPTPKVRGSKATGATATCSAVPKSCASAVRSAASATPTELGKLNYNAGIMFEKPGVIGPASKFFANLKASYEHPDAYDIFSVKGNAGVSYELTRQQTVSASLAVDYSDIEDALNPDGKRYLLVSTPLQYAFDNRDDKLNPTRGFRALAYVEPTYDALNGNAFVKLKGEGSAYYGLGDQNRFVLAGRVAMGSILGAGLDDVPADRRFYSGGGGSVRGYAYQGIGPEINGKPTGGLSYAETSVEIRYNYNDKIGIVPFIDAGTVSARQFPDFGTVKVGAGIGVRYLTPFGPLRVDVAVPLNPGPGDPSYGFYAGVGQAF